MRRNLPLLLSALLLALASACQNDTGSEGGPQQGAPTPGTPPAASQPECRDAEARLLEEMDEVFRAELPLDAVRQVAWLRAGARAGKSVPEGFDDALAERCCKTRALSGLALCQEIYP